MAPVYTQQERCADKHKGLVQPLHLLSQATYVLLALAWVFVPVYISSGVSSHTRHSSQFVC